MRLLKLISTVVLLLAVAPWVATAQDIHAHDHHCSAGHLDAYAPIGVMGDHTHHEGGWMLSYRFNYMEMSGNRDGTDRVSTAEVLEKYMVAPTDMTMQMHMLGVMWAPADRLTLMGMLPYMLTSMDHVTRAGMSFTTDAEGIGDVKVSALYVLRAWGGQQVHVNAGLSLPTGSIDEKDTTPAGRVRLPYPMQLGSGTYDVIPGVTYIGQTDSWSWGSQLIAVLRLGENSNDYTLGDRADVSAWGARKWTTAFSTSLRLDLQSWENIDGADPELNPAVVPTADSDRRGGTRLDLLVGGDLYGQHSWKRGHRLALEVGVPVYQDLDGPQLETDWLMTAGWHYTW